MFALDPYERNYEEEWMDYMTAEFMKESLDIIGQNKFLESLRYSLALAIESGEVTEFDNDDGLSLDHVACFMCQYYPTKRREMEASARYYRYIDKLMNNV